MATIEEVKSKIDLAVTANESGDYATALKYLRSAEMILIAIPSSVERGNEKLEFSRVIDKLRAELITEDNKSKSSASGRVRFSSFENFR
jgi:hypothetical protein